MKIPRTQLLPQTGMITNPATKEFADRLINYLDNTIRKIAAIPFNMSESLEVADTGNADTEFSVTHHLDRIPTGYMLTYNDKACSVYDSGTAWTKHVVYLKCDTANVNIKLVVF